MTDYIGKKVVLGNGDVVTIKSLKDGYYITDGDILKDIKVLAENVKEYGENDIDYIAVAPDTKTDVKENLEDVELTMDTDYTGDNIYVTIKKRSGDYKVVKTTKKTVHFIDHENDDKKRYVNLKSVKKSYRK